MPDALNHGWVYLMRNKSMPTRVKVGFTMGDPMERANQLSTPTGIPEPFEVVGSVQTPWPREVEEEVHRHFSDLRVSPVREFFKADQDSILDVVTEDELNAYYMLIIKQSVERVDLWKRRESLDCQMREMDIRLAQEHGRFLFDCMKKHRPGDYEQMLQRFEQAEDREDGSGAEG